MIKNRCVKYVNDPRATRDVPTIPLKAVRKAPFTDHAELAEKSYITQIFHFGKAEYFYVIIVIRLYIKAR